MTSVCGSEKLTYDPIMNVGYRPLTTIPLGIGAYSAAEAARLLRVPVRNIRRWLGGYSFQGRSAEPSTMPPLWQPQIVHAGGGFELGFRDLIELRFVAAFLDAGVDLRTIRNCLDHARRSVEDDRPFSTRRFQTDGRTIFLESQRDSGEAEVLDLKRQQYVIRDVIDRTFKDLDVEADAVVRWRPHRGKPSIIIDPRRSFGQPIAAETGVPTVILAEAVEAEGSVERASAVFEVPVSVVNDAVAFETSLLAA